MSDVKVVVDIKEALDDLTLIEQKLVLEYLKKEMGEEFDTPIAEDERPRYAALEADVWVDVDDVVNELHSSDKHNLYTELKEEFGEDQEDSDSPFSGGTTSEEEFGKILANLWESRWMLTPAQKARIEAITKESYT